MVSFNDRRYTDDPETNITGDLHGDSSVHTMAAYIRMHGHPATVSDDGKHIHTQEVWSKHLGNGKYESGTDPVTIKNATPIKVRNWLGY